MKIETSHGRFNFDKIRRNMTFRHPNIGFVYSGIRGHVAFTKRFGVTLHLERTCFMRAYYTLKYACSMRSWIYFNIILMHLQDLNFGINYAEFSQENCLFHKLFFVTFSDPISFYPNFHGKYYISLDTSTSTRMRIHLIVMPHSVNGLLLFSHGKHPGSYIYMSLNNGILRACFNCGRKGACEDAFIMQVYENDITDLH